MLLHQFCGQVELYTGKPAPFEVMTEALLEEIRQFGWRAGLNAAAADSRESVTV